MRYVIVVVLGLCGGCGSLPLFTKSSTPAGEPPGIHLYKHVVHYQMLGQTNGEACANAETVKQYSATSNDPRVFGPPVLFELAKFNALGKIAEADGLVGLRVAVEYRNNDECVSLSGRAYRITGMMATPDAVGGSAEPVQ